MEKMGEVLIQRHFEEFFNHGESGEIFQESVSPQDWNFKERVMSSWDRVGCASIW